jgi:hypothetical protein
VDVLEYAIAPLGSWRRRPMVVERVEVALRDLGPSFDGYRIAFLSDLHASPLVPRWWLEHAVEVVLKLAADLVALGGDFVDDDMHFVPLISKVLRPLNAPDGVVAVLGNHDHYVDPEAVRSQLSAAGIRELRNQALVIERGGDHLAVAGIGDLECDVIDFDAAVGHLPADLPRVVLTHDPDAFAYWPDGLRLDLMLCGHTHGGQAYLPFLGPPFVPSQFGFRYLSGTYREADRLLYVSRGVGVSGAPFRWRCPPEITEVVLRPAS